MIVSVLRFEMQTVVRDIGDLIVIVSLMTVSVFTFDMQDGG